MSEIFFEVREADDGGFWARSLDDSIFTQGETLEELRLMVEDAVASHFADAIEKPKVIRFQFVRDEVPVDIVALFEARLDSYLEQPETGVTWDELKRRIRSDPNR